MSLSPFFAEPQAYMELLRPQADERSQGPVQGGGVHDDILHLSGPAAPRGLQLAIEDS